jgi:pimeloyl-ACP methyl ester carboxylesterase
MKDIPLVLVHGYPFDHTIWYSTIAALGSNARVLAPDVPGFGRTPLPHAHPASLTAAADALAQLLEEKGAERAVVAGMSMGGYIALAFAERYPGKLAGLGLISTQTTADTPEARKGREEMIQKIRANGPQAAAEAILPKMFASEKPRDPALAEFAVRGAANAGAEGLCWALRAMAERPDRTETTRELDLPVLVAHGPEDRIVPFAKARALAESCRRPIFAELRGAGHATPLEAPDALAAALARLMAQARLFVGETVQAN